MHVIILSLFWILFCFSMLYIFIMGMITIGWVRIPRFSGRSDGVMPNLSIIMAVRNEQDHIENVLHHLSQQHYSKKQFEIIVINDHSEDNTVQLIEQFIKDNKDTTSRLIHSKGKGKKEALFEGISQAKNDLIITTDADCSMGCSWLSQLAEYYVEKKPKLIVGPVVYENKKGFWQHFYRLDFMSLVASGAGSLGMGLPLMANGANLVFERQTYLDVVNAQSGKSHASGDDVFLLHAISDKYGSKSVYFIKDELAIVKTSPPESFGSFISQRKRWASKATAYKSWWAIGVSISVFLLNLALALSFLMAFFKPWFLILYGLFVLLKIMVDFPLLLFFAEFANVKKTLPYLFVFGYIYPFYIALTGITSLFYKYNWRGRKGLK